MIKVENIVQEIQNPVCVNSGNSRIIWRISIFLEFPEFLEKFPEFRDSLGISGGVRSTEKNFKKCPKILHFLAESRVKNSAPLVLQSSLQEHQAFEGHPCGPGSRKANTQLLL